MEIKLNLIPEYRKEEIRQSNLMKAVLRWELEIAFFLGGFLLLLMSLNQILQMKLDVQSVEIAKTQDKSKHERLKELDGIFKDVNSKIALDKSIQKDQIYWSRFFEKIERDIPDEVRVGKIANRNYGIMLAGEAATREDLLKLEENFLKEECFTEVNLPLSNLVSKNDVAFQIEFKIKEECVKNR